jgi:hypothetical protein
MSAKWRRSLAFDDAFFPRWAWPFKALLRLFSSIPLAVVLLLLVSFYGVLASVPVGIVVLGLTQAFYGVTILVMIALAWAVLVLPARGLIASRGTRFLATIVGSVVAIVAGCWLWYVFAWPILHFDPATGGGVRFFADFVDRTKAITIRRLPGMEMSELEFYNWWPLRVILLMFVANMIIATLRRIEFNFKNIGVLTVHTGIVTIAIGSVYYNGLKREGDTILLAAQPNPADPKAPKPAAGPAVNAFYDATRVALFMSQKREWGSGDLEQRVLSGVPRYNDYKLAAFQGRSILELSRRQRVWQTTKQESALDLAVPDSQSALIDPDIKFRVVGYASYAEPTEDWREVEPKEITSIREGFRFNPLRSVFLLSARPDASGKVNPDPVFSYILRPGAPARRLSVNNVLGIEYTLGPSMGMSEERWTDLSSQIPADAQHAIVVEIPGPTQVEKPLRKVLEIAPGVTHVVGGYTLTVDQITPEPPFPIVTESHKGATSSVAVIKIKPPKVDGKDSDSFTRYVYHRFPELNQDILDTPKPDGRMNRRAADASIRIGYIDASIVQVYFDEVPSQNSQDPTRTRAIVRQPGGNVRVFDALKDGELKDFVPDISLQVDQRWAHAIRVDRPRHVPEDERDRRMIGTHDKAMLAVEVRIDPSVLPKDVRSGTRAWSTVLWLPFAKFLSVDRELTKRLELPDGRELNLTFGRARHVFSDFAIRLVDFKMISYDHRGAPRDFESVVRVEPLVEGFSGYEHACSLNEPLTAPFIWDERRPWIRNAAYRLISGLNPNQFKMSQAAWDEQGWRESQKLADAGMIPAPRARFTILQVGNNPGIHVIALGGVLMAMGIPWAFYLKPYLVRREKRLIQEAVARGEYIPKKPKAEPNVVVVRNRAAADLAEPKPTEAGELSGTLRS